MLLLLYIAESLGRSPHTSRQGLALAQKAPTAYGYQAGPKFPKTEIDAKFPPLPGRAVEKGTAVRGRNGAGVEGEGGGMVDKEGEAMVGRMLMEKGWVGRRD